MPLCGASSRGGEADEDQAAGRDARGGDAAAAADVRTTPLGVRDFANNTERAASVSPPRDATTKSALKDCHRLSLRNAWADEEVEPLSFASAEARPKWKVRLAVGFDPKVAVH